jgi:hypothetical protein
VIGDEELPLLDEHVVRTSAEPDRVWRALPAAIAGAFAQSRGGGLARLLGCRDDGDGARFVAVEGTTVPGFRVERVEAPRELELGGRHRFARYTLTFRIEPRAGGSSIHAETRAEFPGVHGAVYRALVVGSGGHRIVTRRILRSIARRAERAHSHREEGK